VELPKAQLDGSERYFSGNSYLEEYIFTITAVLLVFKPTAELGKGV
jgi:hypothetical protein